MRALRYLHAHGPPSMSAVKLLGSFMHAGHLCLVLERLHSSLLDYLSHSAILAAPVQLTNLRQLAYQLTVSLWIQFWELHPQSLAAFLEPSVHVQ